MKDLSLNSNKFAENQLKKYGWKQGNFKNILKNVHSNIQVWLFYKGEGIGKTSQGIADPIKASFKFDNTGVNLINSYKFNSKILLMSNFIRLDLISLKNLRLIGGSIYIIIQHLK